MFQTEFCSCMMLKKMHRRRDDWVKVCSKMADCACTSGVVYEDVKNNEYSIYLNNLRKIGTPF